MGNQYSEMETEESMHQKYDRIMKMYSFAEVLITFGEAKHQLWYNKKYIPDDVFIALANEEIEASQGSEETKISFRSDVFEALIRYVPGQLLNNDPVSFDINPNKTLLQKVKQFAYVRLYLTPQESRERDFWNGILGMSNLDLIIKKMDSWDKDWRSKV
jgi:hypothetical protein